MRHDLLSRLKQETAACHSRLEHALDLMRDGLLRDHYIALLGRFYGYVAPWEDAVAVCLPASLQAFFDERRKAPLLAADLAALSGERAAAESVVVADARSLPRLDDLGSAFGSLYVMEGSTLGGRFIAPHVAAQLSLAPGVGNAYFDGYGSRTGSMWNAFRETAAAVVPEAQYDAAVRAAIETFESLQAWLCVGSLDAPAISGAAA
ncbi:biliverdin-producing heme oxygenase [Caballeronia sp. LZ062]|uniref:biliverdin-producing heme oxygenase n=1 Tax=unclassified Caballeronia TaxID=2646786 RepID=UPI00285A5D6C|nr:MULTISPECIES: biliverdin-producing heme oxygenase [unclassified Caballeronia]MDR5854628.1 biliverdin-producing heme oxygenase [Caballeronia sp. LZ050]MDR5870844.1 biliverdin-producing heme oxygenase [Caballeronia sp. LZ062]